MVEGPTPRCRFAERDRARLRRRLAALAGGRISGGEVQRLAAGEVALTRKLALPARHAVAAMLDPDDVASGQLERIVGATLDLVPVAFLDRMRRAADAVGRVVDDRLAPVGTGFLVSDRLFLTNHHVTPTAAVARTQRVEMAFELDVDGRPVAATSFTLDPDAFFLSSPDDDLDFILVALGGRVLGDGVITDFGHVRLSPADDKHAVGEFVTVIQHPGGDFKQVALRENRIIGRGRDGTTLHYGADTLGGSSGSPVLNDQGTLVALHHAGGPRNERVLDDGGAVPADSNEGIRVSAIATRLERTLDDLDDVRRDLLLAVLSPDDGVAESTGTAIGPVLPHAPSDVTGRGAGILGVPVPLPRLPGRLGLAAAVPVRPPGTTDVVVRDAGFRVVQHAERRTPLAVAAELRLPADLVLPPDTGVVPVDAWHPEPRLRDRDQLDRAFLDVVAAGRVAAIPLVCPALLGRDPAAEAFAFRFTNCIPWRAPPGPAESSWVAAAVHAAARAVDGAVVVLTGPVLAVDDPVVAGVRVPRARWQILVRVDPGRGRRATALLTDGDAVEQVTVSEVAARTGLTFDVATAGVADSALDPPARTPSTPDDLAW